jgi:hypothetical protein
VVLKGAPWRELSNAPKNVGFRWADQKLWSFEVANLRQDADRLVSQAWREAFVPIKEEEVPRRTSISSHVGLFPLDTTPIAWEYPSEGICMLDLFGGISIGFATMLQSSIPVRKYFYVERDEAARRVSSHHLALLMRQYPELLSRSVIWG